MAGRWKRARITLTIDAPWPFKGKRTISAWDERVPDYSPNDADRAWIASNLGDVPMRIIDTDPMPAVAMLREVGELADLALADAEARYANHLGRNP